MTTTTTTVLQRRKAAKRKMSKAIYTLVQHHGSKVKVAEVLGVSRLTVAKLAKGHLPRQRIADAVAKAMNDIKLTAEPTESTELVNCSAPQSGNGKAPYMNMHELLNAIHEQLSEGDPLTRLAFVEAQLGRIETNLRQLCVQVGAEWVA